MRPLPAVLLVLPMLGACSGAPLAQPSNHSTPPNSVQANARVVSITDGDTITIGIGGTKEKLRLIGIDTPETKKPDTPVQCYGPEATAYMTALLPVGTPLHIERDVVARDKYGRLLAYVYRVADHTFINLDIIRHGYARLLTIPPNDAHVEDFTTAVQAAQHDHIGLWAKCTG